MKKKNNIFVIIGALILVSTTSYLIYLRFDRTRNGVVTKAVIYDTAGGKRGQPYVHYQFIVDSVMYNSSDRYWPDRDSFSIGDSCDIIYSSKNPKNNLLVRNSDKSLKITKQQKKK